MGHGAVVTISEPNEEKVELITSLGFDRILKPQDLPPNSFDVVIEAVGIPATVEQSIEIARRGARIVWFSVVAQGAKAQIEPYKVFQKELTICGSFINPSTHARALS